MVHQHCPEVTAMGVPEDQHQEARCIRGKVGFVQEQQLLPAGTDFSTILHKLVLSTSDHHASSVLSMLYCEMQTAAMMPCKHHATV